MLQVDADILQGVFTAAILDERNNRMIFIWEINFIFMQISFIVWLLQHGRRTRTQHEIVRRKSPVYGAGVYINVPEN